MSYIYLASPYINPSDPGDYRTREDRYRAVAQATAHLLSRGYFIFSPICHCHHISKEYGLAKTFDFWKKIDFCMISRSKELWILTLDGWTVSKGIKAEVDFAKAAKIKVREYTLKEILEMEYLEDGK